MGEGRVGGLFDSDDYFLNLDQSPFRTHEIHEVNATCAKLFYINLMQLLGQRDFVDFLSVVVAHSDFVSC